MRNELDKCIDSLSEWLKKVDSSELSATEYDRILAAVREARNEIAYVLTKEVA